MDRHLRLGISLTLAALATSTSACGVDPTHDDASDGEAALAPAAHTTTTAPKPLAPGYRLHTDQATRLRFPVRTAGITVESRHFDATLPTYKFRHSIRLLEGKHLSLLIDVWDNPRRLPLATWFDEHLAYLVGEATDVSERAVTAARLPGILLAEPASEQAASQAIAVFAYGDQVFRVTCLDPVGDAAARDSFEAILAALEPGVIR
jgi:hypothetical protein